MPVLTWDQAGHRKFESGLDRGVLYLPSEGTAVPWNGLVSVIENINKSTTPVYYDGKKINEIPTFGEFAATMSAITYPDEFDEIEGAEHIRRGVLVGEQAPKLFGLCYRTRVGNDLEGEEAGYKIHVIWNLTAIPSDKAFKTVSDNPEIVLLEWKITALPEDIPGYRPTAHIVIDTTNIDPWLLEDLEAKLYGSTISEASLIPMSELMSFISEWYRVKITDNGDGTWTALEGRPGFITRFPNPPTTFDFMIEHVNAYYIDADTYSITDTDDVIEDARIKVVDNGDGTFTVSTDGEEFIEMDVIDRTFTVFAIDTLFSGPDMFRITDTHTT